MLVHVDAPSSPGGGGGERYENPEDYESGHDEVVAVDDRVLVHEKREHLDLLRQMRATRLFDLHSRLLTIQQFDHCFSDCK